MFLLMAKLGKTQPSWFLKRLALGLVSFFIFGLMPVHAANDRASAPASNTYNKAVALYNKGKWDHAREYLHQYLAEYSDTPLYVTCLYYLAYCYHQLKEKEEALRMYNKVIGQARGGDEFWAQMSQKRIEELTEEK